jgi:hypothetical protein
MAVFCWCAESENAANSSVPNNPLTILFIFV